MNGALIVDKPAGPTSHDVVARVRRALGTRKIGHTGTLDPLATGVLALLVGRATRLARFLASDEKAYIAAIRLGCATRTYDAEDRVVRTPGSLTLQPPGQAVAVPDMELREALGAFSGTFWQVPPPFSAKKVGGVTAHRMARRDIAVEIPPVQVTVRELELLAHEGGLVSLRIVCSSGFYVRSLAHDLGQRLGCGAHLETLRRTRAGEFGLDRSVPLDTIEADGSGAASRLVPMAALLQGLPSVVVNERGARRVAHGNPLSWEDLRDRGGPAEGPIRVLDPDGSLLAIGQPGGSGLLQPVVVLM
jgi:tRNA pseudouridine55 synthase